MKDDTRKKEEHIYPVKSPAQFNQAVTPISPVSICLNPFLGPITFNLSSCDDCLSVLSDPSRLDLPINSVVTFLSLIPRKYPLIQLRLARHLPHFYNLLTIPQMYFQIPILLPQLDYNSQFLFLRTISLKLQKHFLHLAHFCLTFDPFLLAPLTSNSSLIIPFLDVNDAVNIILTTHAEPNEPGLINNYNTVSNQSSANGK